MRATTKLRQLLSQKEIVIGAGCWDPLSARLVELEGFPVTNMSGSSTSQSMIGKTDTGYITQTEMIDNARRIAATVKIPVIADGDDGFGTPLNAMRTVQLYERAGVAAVHIEDVAIPKGCPHAHFTKLIPMDVMVAKIRAAVAAREDPDFVIIGRTDHQEGFNSVLARATAYLEAGADLIFIAGFESVEEMKAAGQALKGRLLVDQEADIRIPLVPPAELEAMGFRVILYPVTAWIAAYSTAWEVLKGLRAELKNLQVAPKLGASMGKWYGKLTDVVGMQEEEKLVAKYIPSARWGRRDMTAYLKQ